MLTDKEKSAMETIKVSPGPGPVIGEAEKLFAAIEPIEEKSFFTSYDVGLFNKRGLTSRGPYEGGEIERDNAEHFAMLYEKYKTRYPRVTKVFKDLSEQYARMAKDMDNEADIAKLDY